MRRPKDVLTTGEVARLCNVAPRTVSKWFDTGKLRGYRIPGSRDRRIPLQQLVRFMKAHGIPLNGLDSGLTRVLIVDADKELSDLLSNALSREGGYECLVARTTFEAGAVAQAARPQVMLIDVESSGMNGRETVRTIRELPDLAGTRLVAVTSSTRAGESETLRQAGFDAALCKPLEIAQVVRTIEDVLSIVS